MEEWQQQGYLYKSDYENNQIADFLKFYSWEEVCKRTDLFDRVLGPDELSAATIIKMQRTALVADLVTDLRQIPSDFLTALLVRFAKFDFSAGLPAFEAEVKEFLPRVEFKPDLNLADLQKEAKTIANGLSNLFKVAAYQEAEGCINTIQILNKLSADRLAEFKNKVKTLDSSLAESMERDTPLDPANANELGEILKQAGRVNLEVKELSELKDKEKFARIIEEILKSIVIIEQAHKDGASERINQPAVIAEELERYQNDNADKIFQRRMPSAKNEDAKKDEDQPGTAPTEPTTLSEPPATSPEN